MKELAQTSLGREVEEIVAQARKGDALVNPIQVDDDDVDTIDNQWAADEAEYDADIAKIESIDLTQTSEEVFNSMTPILLLPSNPSPLPFS